MGDSADRKNQQTDTQTCSSFVPLKLPCVTQIQVNYNIISNKFKKTDYFSLDERELELFVGKKRLNHEKSLKSLNKFLSSKKSFLTCGGKFSLMYSKNSSTSTVPEASVSILLKCFLNSFTFKAE